MARTSNRRWKGCRLCKPHKDATNGQAARKPGQRRSSGTDSQRVHARRNRLPVVMPHTGLSGRPGTPASTMR